MKLRAIYVLIFVLFFSSLSSFGQQKNNSQLAFQYFRSKEFDRAAILYSELYEQSHSKTYLNYLVKCYNELGSYEKAEKLLRKEIKKNKRDASLKVLLGTIYKASGKEEKAEKLYLKTIEQIDDRRQSVINLANAFVSNREYKYAEQTYLKKHKKNEVKSNFTFELANIYYYWRRYDKMIDTYLEVLENSNRYLKSIQSRLQYSVYTQDDGSLNEKLKKKLIAKVQKSNQNDNYIELLIWVYLQEKDFRKAFVQTRAIDKRKQEEGKRLIELGKMAIKNKDTETAIDCFEYVKNLGSDKTYYFDAEMGYISSLQTKVLEEENANAEQIQNLVNEYESFLKQPSHPNQRAEICIDFAHLLCFYQHNITKSLSILEEVIAQAGLTSATLSRAKIEYADQLLYNGQIWNATLFYSQVIKRNPNNETGNIAQLKKAKLAFYSGDFLWAKGQLDVLKASTSKLISNDAFYISALISDNLEVDSLSLPLELYAQADLLAFRNLTDSAILVLDTIAKNYAEHPIADDVLFKKAEILSHIQVDSAMALYQKFIDEYYSSILADNALMNLANLYWQTNQKEKACELYTQLLVDFPDSFLCTEARQKIVEFRDS